MPITSPNRKVTDLKFWIIEDADLDDDVWSGRKFSRRDLVLNIDTGSLRKGPGVWEDMQVVAEMGGAYSPPIPQSDVTGLVTALSVLTGSTYIIDTGSTNTGVDPGQNTLRINHSSLASATEMSMSDIDGMAVDQSTLASLIGGVLVLRTLSSGATCMVRILNAVHTSFTRFTIQHLKGTWPADGAVVSVSRAPDVEPKVWNALVYWNGGSPYAEVLGKNTIGNIVVSDSGSGDGSGLFLTLTGAFPAEKTMCFTGNSAYDTNGDTGVIYASRYSNNAIALTGSSDYPFDGCPVRIEVYP